MYRGGRVFLIKGSRSSNVVSAAHPGSWQILLAAGLDEQPDRTGRQRAPCADPSIKAGRPSLQAKRGRTMALVAVLCDGPWVQTLAYDATVNKLCSCTRTAGKELVELPALAQRCQQLPPSPTSTTHSAARHGLHARVRRGLLGRRDGAGSGCWTVLLVLGRAQCDCQPRYGLARPDALSSLQQGSRRHPVPSQSERREGLGVRARSG